MRKPFNRHLRLLGFDSPPAGLDGLRQLVRAHLLRVPFENVSKLLLFDHEGTGRLNTLDEFLDGIEHHDLGGTCYKSNPFLAQLLRELGYEADLHSADMNNPNVHSCIRVRLNGRAYHVDVGNAAPFLEPFPLDALPYEFVRGEMKWVFDRAEDSRVRCKLFSGGEHVHGYMANESPCTHEDFREVILDSFQRGRTFTSLLRIVRIFPEHTVELKNRTLRVHRGTSTTETTLNDMKELRHAVDTQFLLPRCPIEKAVEILERFNGIEFFGAPQERSLYL
jgi:N-hydroxyarylamine O-acetyltransferase